MSSRETTAEARMQIEEAWFDADHDPDCAVCRYARIRDLIRENRDDLVYRRIVELVLEEDSDARRA